MADREWIDITPLGHPGIWIEAETGLTVEFWDRWEWDDSPPREAPRDNGDGSGNPDFDRWCLDHFG